MRCTTELTVRFSLAHAPVDLVELAEREELALRDPDVMLGLVYIDPDTDEIEMDALDTETVPYDGAVDVELALELFEQDAAEDRFFEFWAHEEEHLRDRAKIAHDPNHYRKIMREMEVRRTKQLVALQMAKKMRPDLNWASYDDRARMGVSIF